MRIKSIKARQIINSKGLPSLEIEVSTNKFTVSATAPVAVSKSKYEYVDVTDHDLKKFDGNTLSVVIDNLQRVVAPELIGKRSMDQEDLDSLILEIDASVDRSRLGVNTITALSQAIAKVGALESDLPLFKYIRVLHDFSDLNHEKLMSEYLMPKPVITIAKSNSHNRNSNLPFQELMVLPENKFSYLKDLIPLFDLINKKQVDSAQTLKKFIQNTEEEYNKTKLQFGIDMSASRFKRDDLYVLNNFHNKNVPLRADPSRLVNEYLKLFDSGKFTFLEDLFDEDEYAIWHEFRKQILKINRNTQVVSDDFTATNLERLEKIALLDAANNVVIKPSQAGTVTEVLHFAARARKAGMNLTVSYRFGETEDTFISDLAVGINSDYIRTGYYLGSEHNAKLNRLIQIEQSL